MSTLHPVILVCWLILAVCVAIVLIALCLDWWEHRIHATNRQHLTQRYEDEL